MVSLLSSAFEEADIGGQKKPTLKNDVLLTADLTMEVGSKTDLVEATELK